ncbi:uncharacterized protein LOC117536879 [Scomber scombrus]|uniref:Uncharacterized protein LOC117536879 n=1 Tax=Scomber scombrus TaxID=13677 RepID=A0AAV1PMZ2_SCOSC
MASSQQKRSAALSAKARNGANANTDQEISNSDSSNATILQAIQCLKDDLVKKMDENTKSQSLELKQEITLLREELKGSIEQVSSRTKALEDKVESMHTACNNHSDAICTLDDEVQRLKRDIKVLSDKNEDLEARSRRCNLRITGVREKREAGKAPLEFMAGLLHDTLGLDTCPTLDRSHRTLRERPGDDQPPQAFVIKCHYYQEKEAILRKAAKAEELITPDGDRMRVYPDYTQTVLQQRNAFREAKGILRGCSGEDYRLRYPAVLQITTKSDGQRHSFADPIKARDFALRLPGATQNG